jgi:hypothetical protein
MRTGVVIALALSCTRVVVGLITPEHFQFTQVVAMADDEVGGWQAVCIHATLRDGNTGRTVMCDFEVGVPLQNKAQGAISRRFAQVSAASAANNAAHGLLSQYEAGLLLGMICQQFRPAMQAELNVSIAGAKVTKCYTQGIPTVPFDSAPVH